MSSCGPRIKPARASRASGNDSTTASSAPRLSAPYSALSALGSPSTSAEDSSTCVPHA